MYVPDQPEAAAWYQASLGLLPLSEYQVWAETGGPLMISSDAGATKLALCLGDAPGFGTPAGAKRIAFWVDGPTLLAFLMHIQTIPVYTDAGEPSTSLPLVNHDLAYSLYFCDPYGNRLELTTYDCLALQRKLLQHQHQ